MKPSQMGRILAIGAACVGGVALWTAGAQPQSGQPTTTPAPAAGAPTAEPPSVWHEKFREELRDHPRLARSIVSLHETKEYLEKAPNTFGGHKAAAIAACESAIKELMEALRYDAKEEPRRAPATGGTPNPGGQSH